MPGAQFVDVLVPTIVTGHDYSAAPMVSVVVGDRHVCALDVRGGLYTWGVAIEFLYEVSDDGGPIAERKQTGALGHTNMSAPLVLAPMLLDVLQDKLRVAGFKLLSPSYIIAFCMGTKHRLAHKLDPTTVSLVYSMPLCIVRKILEETVVCPRLSSHAQQGLKNLFGCMEVAGF